MGTIDGTAWSEVTIDGQAVQEITVDGSVVWTSSLSASGGTNTFTQNTNGTEYTIHAFENTGSNTLSIDSAPQDSRVDVLLVAGGGGGGGGDGGSAGGGGGGAGGVVIDSKTVSTGNHTIFVGGGGRGGYDNQDDSGNNGNDSSAFGLTAIGGGGGGSRHPDSAQNGGSGGGGPAHDDTGEGGSGTPPQGMDGGGGGYSGGGGDNPAAGGGGYSQPGQQASNDTGPGGDGGDGYNGTSFVGTSYGDNGWFAGGGGGGDGGSGGPGSGGKGGGASGYGNHAQSYTGGGGGGMRSDSDGGDGGNGGSGVAFVRYPSIVRNSSFEDMSVWNVNYGSQNTSRVYNGSYSFYSGNNDTNMQASWVPYSEGARPNKFTYFYQETSSSTGGGIRLVNSDGNYEGGTATDNSEYDVDFANTSGEIMGTTGDYNQWVKVTWTFDWSNSNVDIRFDGLSSGITTTGTYSLYYGTDIRKVELWNYNGGTWGDNDLNMWWDKLRFS